MLKPNYFPIFLNKKINPGEEHIKCIVIKLMSNLYNDYCFCNGYAAEHTCILTIRCL